MTPMIHHRKVQLDNFLREFQRNEQGMSTEQHDLIMLQVRAMATAIVMLDGLAGDKEHKDGIDMSPAAFYHRSRTTLHHLLGVEETTPDEDEILVGAWFEATHLHAWQLWSAP